MANGVLGTGLSSANSNVAIYTVPASGVQFATISLTMVNTGTVPAKVKLAISTSLNPSLDQYIEFGAELAANGGVLERTCIMCSPGEKIVVNANTSDVAVRVFGMEQL